MFHNGTLTTGDTDTHYIRFGKGDKALILIPGLADGLKTVKGMALPFSLIYRRFAKEYTVYSVSRKNKLDKGYTTRHMAADLNEFMEKSGIQQAAIVGISQGGMIAQYLAIDYPERVSKLVLAVTMSKQNHVTENAVRNWIELAKKGAYRELMTDTAKRAYTQRHLRRLSPFFAFLPKKTKRLNVERFIIQAQSCLMHNAYDELDKIKCPVLVIGGEQDRVVDPKESKDIADKIPGSHLYVYPDYGHGLYEEAKDFNARITDYLTI